MILAFDTSDRRVCMALLKRGTVTTHVEDMARGQAEALLPMIEELLHRSGATWPEIKAIAVGVGPGNFTGIRISVSAARGMALGLGIPAIGISAFDMVRHLAPMAQGVTVPGPRDQVYLSLTPSAAPYMTPADQCGDATSIEAFAPDDLILAAAKVGQERLSANNLTPAKPLYIKPADAAPARDLPPTIIDS
ncbi:tRNA (adenosine(37)-N6)-threonylcarbamoyltransferase complex dimerization subunit type 1 TsaB [Shimia ponticola]|uniref:tRNA (adenosine(37)-N6)-threonylcarbamoyltransferase complex dimerization subunit type 1 TsaB n=1 Tax=Shimia ponticola TaxID=2582893 RepID=UPI0011BE0A78|nr:tRNA (adenosine(37)-N6)-threonylcarbamoyltransferase complex dimerization subunit type 1 TsaB [Shimia ponticola]